MNARPHAAKRNAPRQPFDFRASGERSHCVYVGKHWVGYIERTEDVCEWRAWSASPLREIEGTFLSDFSAAVAVVSRWRAAA